MLDFKLYFIADIKPQMKRSPADLVAQAVAGGVDIVQLRCKKGSNSQLLDIGEEIKPLLQTENIPLIINDRVDIALALEADGVHLGQDDMPVELARHILGPGKIMGKSTHGLEQALAAQAEGVDYLAIGPIFPTATKQLTDHPLGIGILKELAQRVRIPWLAIGGINQGNLEEVIRAGARRIAVASAIADADDITQASRELKACLTRGEI